MNIFLLSWNPYVCALWHCDKHCVKMILEYAQMLSSAHRVLDTIEEGDDRVVLYKIAHKNHPCTIWTRESSSNYQWLYKLFCNLCNEYTRRYNKVHETDRKLRNILQHCPVNIEEGPITEPAQAMPDQYKVENDAIMAYRLFYRGDKRSFAVWKKGEEPWWFFH